MKSGDLAVLGVAAAIAVGLVWYAKKSMTTATAAPSTSSLSGEWWKSASAPVASWQDSGFWNPLTGSFEPYTSY